MGNKAWLYEQYGDAQVLKLGEFQIPELKESEVLIKVEAAALNPVDWKRREGYLSKLIEIPFPVVPGHDVAGVVIETGTQVSKFKKGDEVYGDIFGYGIAKSLQLGTLAQYTVAEEKLLALKPKNLSFEEAASLPLAILTAQGAFDKAALKPGESVLILGGAGGVGSLAIQLAKVVYGASLVAATASTKKLELLKSLGADVVIDYTQTKYEDISEKYDLVFDTIGEIKKAEKLVKEAGRAITIVVFEHPNHFILTANGDNLAKLTPYFENGKLKPLLDPKSPFPFSDVVGAFKHLETGRAIGKVVISPIH